MATSSPSGRRATNTTAEPASKACLVSRSRAQSTEFHAAADPARPDVRTESHEALLRLSRLMGRLAARANLAAMATNPSASNPQSKDIS